MSTCPLFVELCAGSAAVTLRLLSAHARPPISYMGAKTGYAQAILHVLGLRSGQGAAACVLVEAGPWARAWRLLTTPEGCRAVAAVIRGWIGEDARALWERLRSEPTPEGEAEAVGAWMWVKGMEWASSGHFDPIKGGYGWTDRKGREWGTGVDPFAWSTDRLSLLSSLSWPPVQVVEGDVTEVDPREVAVWLALQGGMYNNYAVWPEGGKWASPAGSLAPNPSIMPDSLTHPGTWPEYIPPRCEVAHEVWPPTVISNAPVQDVAPGVLPPGTVVYFDPPYQGTTGYQAKLTRAQVLTVAQRWADAGATVCVSEAEPLDLTGWHHVEITGTRIGQKRTFSKQQHEWLTLNREPAWLPETQGTLGLEVIA